MHDKIKEGMSIQLEDSNFECQQMLFELFFYDGNTKRDAILKKLQISKRRDEFFVQKNSLKKKKKGLETLFGFCGYPSKSLFCFLNLSIS